MEDEPSKINHNFGFIASNITYDDKTKPLIPEHGEKLKTSITNKNKDKEVSSPRKAEVGNLVEFRIFEGVMLAASSQLQTEKSFQGKDFCYNNTYLRRNKSDLKLKYNLLYIV